MPRPLLFCWMTVPTSLADFSVPQPGYTCSFSLSPPCLYTAPSSLPHRFLPSSSMFSSRLKLSYVLSMVVNIYLPRKLLFLNAYCLCGCLFPLLTWTPWIIPQNLQADWMIAYWTLWPGRLCKLNCCLAAGQELVLKTLSSKDFTWCS